MENNPDKSEMLDVSNFKRIMHKMKLLDHVALNNLAEYLDTNNEGLISIGGLTASLSTTPMPKTYRPDSSMRKPTKTSSFDSSMRKPKKTSSLRS